ncbi:MAG: energy transducer TonB [Aliiglaciecola sp.]
MRRTIIFGIAFAFTFNQAFAETTFSEAFSQYNQAIENQDHTAAVEHALVALSLGQQKFGQNSENAINLQYNLGLAYLQNRQLDEGFDTLADVANQYSETKGEVSIERFNALLDQLSSAKYLMHKGYQKAPKQYTLLVETLEETLDKTQVLSDVQQAQRLYLFSKILYERPLSSWFFDVALEMSEKAENLLVQTLGNEDAKTVEVQFRIARFKQAQRKRTEAAEYYEKIVNTFGHEMETSHPLELASRAALVDLYERLGESDRATEHCVAIGHLTPWQSDIEPTPLYRLEPMYPMEEARKNKQGNVVLSFDIDTFGFVKNIKVISKEGSYGFAKQARRALQKWRYAPKIVDGKPEVAKNMRVQLNFKLNDA